MNATLRRIEPRPDPQRLLLVPVQQIAISSLRKLQINHPAKPTIVLQSRRSGIQSSQFSPIYSNPSTPQSGSCQHATHEGGPHSSGSGSVFSFPQKRDYLKRKIEQRPSRQKLVTQHILLSASSADPLIQQRAQLLKKCRIVSNLNRKLKHRPGPLELVTRKILQADAELEQAIQEGRVLFKPTGATEESALPSVESEFNPISPDMEVVSAVPPAYSIEETSSSILSKSKVRKKSTPYRAPTSDAPIPAKPRTKTPQCKEPQTFTLGDENPADTNSYELLLKQQQLFLEWQTLEETQARKQSCESFNSESTEEYVIQQQKTTEQERVPSGMDSLEDPSSSNHNANAYSNQMSNHSCQPGMCNCNESSNIGEMKRLSDYRVQDLKYECKKRQLPVSGPKPQLLERLRPFEKTILSTGSEGGPSTPPTSPGENFQLTTVQASPASATTHVREQTRETIHDYLQQNVPKQQVQVVQQKQSMPMVQIASSNNQQQFVQLVDQNGTVVGMATMANVQHISNGGAISFPQTIQQPQQQIQQQPIQQMQAVSNQNVQTIQGNICYCHEAPGNVAHIHGGPIAVASSSSGTRSVSMQQPQVMQQMQPVQQIHQIQNVPQKESSGDHPTFRFAQLGSGGQFTIVQADGNNQNGSPDLQNGGQIMQGPPQTQIVASVGSQLVPTSVMTSSGQLVTHISNGQVIGHSGIPIQSGHIIKMAPNGQNQQQSQQQEVIVSYEDINSQTSNAPIFAVAQTAPNQCQTQIVNGSQQTVQIAYVENGGQMRRVCHGGSPVGADPAVSSPNLPPASAEQTTATFTIDPNDPSSLANTLSLHEEMLKFQQKKIEEVQRELFKSQQQLRQQQQLIMVAKKYQAQRREGDGGRQSQAEHWLSQLDMGQINKNHIQHFITHKLQATNLQQHVNEQNSLVQTEAKLQEELHVEQAVQDIVRLIKQDARTALLIVQLLRKYQLERLAESQPQTQGPTPVDALQPIETPVQEQKKNSNTSIQNVPQETHQQIQTHMVQQHSTQQAQCVQQHQQMQQNPPMQQQVQQQVQTQQIQPQQIQHVQMITPQQLQMGQFITQNGQIIQLQTVQGNNMILANQKTNIDRAQSASPQVVHVVVQNPNNVMLAAGGQNVLHLPHPGQRRASNPEGMLLSRNDPDVQIISDDEATYPTQPRKSKKRSLQKVDPNQSVDMEAIFKTVLEDASRALRSDDGSYSDGAATTAYGTPESSHNQNSPIDFTQQENVAVEVSCNQQQCHQMAVETTLGQMEHTDQHQSVLLCEQSGSSENSMDHINGESVEILESGHSGLSTHHSNSHPALSQMGNHFYSKTQEMDDLMDVLRDDQEVPVKSNQMLDFGLGYGQDELAQLIGDDWLDSADKTLQQSVLGYSMDNQDQSSPSSLTDPMLTSHCISNDDLDPNNMDWLDMMLQNAPMDDSLEGIRSPCYQRNQMDTQC